MNREPTIADQVRDVPMPWIWAAVFAGVAVAGGFFTPWETLVQLFENQGVGDEQAQLIAFVAGYTAPLTLGLAIISYLLLVGVHRGMNPIAMWLGAAVILIATAWVAQEFGLGLLPDYSTPIQTTGPWFAKPLAWVLSAYINSYGSSLAFCALLIGVAGAVHVERWTQNG